LPKSFNVTGSASRDAKWRAVEPSSSSALTGQNRSMWIARCTAASCRAL
jgi:hypothetical protein